MASGGFDVAKAGWLYRQSSVLRRWKRHWFVLDRQGDLRYFESPDSPKAEERIVVRVTVTQINSGNQCPPVDPPSAHGYTKEGFLELVKRDKDTILLCAESVDDMRAWQIALEEARTLGFEARHPGVVNTTTIMQGPGYPPYGYSYAYNYPGHMGYPTYPMHPGTQVVHTPTGTTTIVNGQPAQQIVYVDDSPRHYRRHYRGGIFPVPIFFW